MHKPVKYREASEASEIAPGDCPLLVLVRHAAYEAPTREPEAERRGRFDPPLSELGRAQAQALADRLTPVEIGLCFCSPLQRARQTAEILTARLRPTLALQVLDSLAEYDRGDLEHRFPGPTIHDQDLEAFWRNGDWKRWPNGETRDGFRARTDAALEKVCNSASDAALIVSHGGVINELLCALLGLGSGGPAVFNVGFSSVTIVQCSDDRARLLLLGDLWHLEDPVPATITRAADHRSRRSAVVAHTA
jgi:2,3-bisphosphoglycerate-dependent phosphoglycerate mutase